MIGLCNFRNSPLNLVTVDSSIGLATHCRWDLRNKAKLDAPISTALNTAFSSPPVEDKKVC
jgi:hypothetical protein